MTSEERNARLINLLVKRFTRLDELRQLVRRTDLEIWSRVDQQPNLRGLAAAVVEALDGEDRVDSRFFDILVEFRPAIEPEIRSCQRDWQRLILFLTADGGGQPLSTEREASLIGAELTNSPVGHTFGLVVKAHVQRADWRKLVERFRPEIIHFAGHGTIGGRLALDDGAGGGVDLPPGPMLEQLDATGVEGVVWSACFSDRLAAEASRRGPWAIGMKGKILDDVAVRFAAGFYEGLASGLQPRDAFDWSLQTARWEGRSKPTEPVFFAAGAGNMPPGAITAGHLPASNVSAGSLTAPTMPTAPPSAPTANHTAATLNHAAAPPSAPTANYTATTPNHAAAPAAPAAPPGAPTANHTAPTPNHAAAPAAPAAIAAPNAPPAAPARGSAPSPGALELERFLSLRAVEPGALRRYFHRLGLMQHLPGGGSPLQDAHEAVVVLASHGHLDATAIDALRSTFPGFAADIDRIAAALGFPVTPHAPLDQPSPDDIRAYVASHPRCVVRLRGHGQELEGVPDALVINVPPDWLVDNAARAEEEIVPPLVHVATEVSKSSREVHIIGQCTPATAIRVGHVFRHVTGIRTFVLAYGREWALDHTQLVAAPLVECFERAGGKGLALLLSIARETRPAYDVWADAHEARIDVLEYKGPEGRDPRTCMTQAGEPLAWARQIVAGVLTRRPEGDKPLHVFAALPTPLAVAVGRELNALGQVTLYDLDRSDQRYKPSFSFRA